MTGNAHHDGRTGGERAETLCARLDALRARDAELSAALRRVRADPAAEPTEVVRLLRECADVQRALAAYERLQAFFQRAFPSLGAEADAHVPDVPVLDGGLYTTEAVYTGAYEAVDVLFVNGILVEFAAFLQGLARVAARWPERTVIGLYNATDDAVHDIWQATNDRAQAFLAARLDASNPAVRHLADVVIAVGERGGGHTLTLVGHSQGGAILSSALNLVVRERAELDLGFLQVFALGSFGVDFPEGPTYHIFVHQFDPVPALAQLRVLPGGVTSTAQLHYFANLTVLRGPLEPLEAHALAGYVADWEAFIAEEHRIRQGNALQRLLGQAGEAAQFQLNPWGVIARLGNQIFGVTPRLPL